MSFDYRATAELYPSKFGKLKRHGLAYRRFDSAAEAVRFAMEQLSPAMLAGTYLEVGESRFDAAGIRDLYQSERYPLARETLDGDR